jgi:hypothetical protein
MEYRFRTISIFYFITILLTLIPVIGITGMKLVGIMESFPAFLFTISTFIISYLIASKLTFGKAQITLSNKKVEFLWVEKPILAMQKNESVNIEDIESWKYRTEFQYSYFKIYNPSDVITVMRLPYWNPEKDDFDNFLFTFKNRIENLNKKRKKRTESLEKNKVKDEKKELIIDKEAKHYKSNVAKILFFVYILCVILGYKYVYNNWNTGKTNIGIVISGILGCIFYINKYRKSGNEK